MYRILISVLLVGGMTIGGCAQKKGKAGKMENANDSLSYAIGVSMAQSFEQQDLKDVNLDMLQLAMQEAFEGNAQMDPKDAENFIRGEMMARQEMKQEKVREEGEAWLAENAKKEGVMVTESGLQYKVIQEGTGASPDGNDGVTVHYHGTLITGEVFDSSVDRGTPATFGVNQVIRGWTEGLQLMKEGAKYMFYIPQELAYGANPRPGGIIEPYMPLVFEVELIQVTPKE